MQRPEVKRRQEWAMCLPWRGFCFFAKAVTGNSRLFDHRRRPELKRRISQEAINSLKKNCCKVAILHNRVMVFFWIERNCLFRIARKSPTAVCTSAARRDAYLLATQTAPLTLAPACLQGQPVILVCPIIFFFGTMSVRFFLLGNG